MEESENVISKITNNLFTIDIIKKMVILGAQDELSEISIRMMLNRISKKAGKSYTKLVRGLRKEYERLQKSNKSNKDI